LVLKPRLNRRWTLLFLRFGQQYLGASISPKENAEVAMAASAAAAEAGGWPRDELARLVQAWGEVVEPPRDREQLSAPELLRLHSRFETLCGRRGDRWLGSMERQRLRLVTAYKFIRALSDDKRSSDRPQWFKMPRTMQEQATRGDADNAAAVMAIDEDLFQSIERILRDDPASTDATASTSINTDAAATDSGGVVDSETDVSGATRDPPTTSTSEAPTADTSFGEGGSNIATGNDEVEARRQQDQNTEGEKLDGRTNGDRENEIKAAEALAGLPIVRVSTSNPPPPSIPTSRRESGRRMDAIYRTNPPLRWRPCDELQLIRAWDNTLRQLVEAKLPCFTLDELVLERYTNICGPNEESASSICAKRLKILNAFKFLRAYLASRPSDAPQWLEMAVSKRLAEQKANGYNEEFVCTLEAADFSSLSSIMENEQRLTQLNREAMGPTTVALERRSNYSSRPPPLGLDSGFDAAVSGRYKETRAHWSVPRGHPTNLRPRYRSSPDIDGSAVLVSLRNASKRRRTTNPLNQQRGGEETKQEEDHVSQGEQPSSSTEIPTLNLMDQLVQAQTRRLELLLEEFREERRQERQQTQELLLLLLSRMDAVPRGDVAALEALVEQQRLHLEQLFDLVEAEREAEWGRAQELLREIEVSRGGRR